MGDFIQKNPGTRGAQEILLCKAVGIDIGKELHRAAQTSSKILEVQLGSEVVNVSTQTLSAGKLGSVSRNYEHRGSELAAHTQSGFNLQASVVIPMYGETPAYLAETMRYYEMAGIKHVYFGIVGEKAKGETLKEQMQPFISRGFVSVLESDEWPDLRIHSHMNGAESLRWKTIINDWALYHAKSWDDLLLLHDYDELMVPTQGNTVLFRAL